jgi:hypothetical protein
LFGYGFRAFFAKTGEAATAKEIEVNVDVALDRFVERVKGAAKFAKNATGLLVVTEVCLNELK